ncbi:MAG: MBL fold metallo-hydrolase, partial [Oscillospiraceae bacterium]
IKELSVEKIFMKKLPRSQTPTTKSYLDFLNAIKDKGLKITEIKSGAGFTMGNGYLTFVNSDKDFDDLNNQSAVVKFEYNSQSFLFTGDIEKQAEKAILKSDISADVLKVAHHGSNTSTTDEFLKKVNPSVAVISVGDDNKYNHPNKDTIEKLKNINVYQTNINGNICINIYDTYLDVVLAKGE